MNYIDYFKSQSKKFYKDFQTQYKKGNEYSYSYKPTFWPDLDEIILSFDIDEDNFSLMKAQHIIAYLADFKNWNELLHANNYQLELGYLLIEHRDDHLLEKWQSYVFSSHLDVLDDESKLYIFKQTFLDKS